jgi:hypothetical protein
LTPFNLQVSISDAQHDQLIPPSSLPAKRLRYSAQDHRADGALDGVCIEVDMTIIDKSYQPVPMVQRIVDRAC